MCAWQEFIVLLGVLCVELITRLSDGCSLVLVQAGALPVLIDVINGTNRNRASLLLVETALQILLNLTRVSWHVYVCVDMCNVCVLWILILPCGSTDVIDLFPDEFTSLRFNDDRVSSVVNLHVGTAHSILLV